MAILDWDLHHGNGTQAIFTGATVSSARCTRRDSFPKTGWVDEIGTAPAGATLNAPLAVGSTIADYRLVFDEVFIPALVRFQPDVLIISAGQDALADDERGQMNLNPGRLRCSHPDADRWHGYALALTLEGGYGPSHGKAIEAIFAALRAGGLRRNEQIPHRSTERL